MLSSNRWDNIRFALKAQGIDGFKVGYSQSNNPGPIYFDQVCDICGQLIQKNSWNSSYVVCSSCKDLRHRLQTTINSTNQLTHFYEQNNKNRIAT